MSKNLNTAYLGANSYPGVLENIHDALSGVTCDTLTGQELVGTALKQMNESTTPILDLKVFTTNAEKVASNDAKLMDVIDFARKQVKNGDLNCLINIAKEEHIQEQTRTGLPSPEATIKNWEDIMSQPASVIEEGIKNGLFKGLESKLYMKLENILTDDDGKTNKSKNPIEAPEEHYEGNILNESAASFSPSGNIAVYQPIGIRFEDVPNDRVLMLTESAALQYDRDAKTFFSLNEADYSTLVIPDRHRRLMNALTHLSYDPKKDTFSLNENWDFSMSVKEGVATLTKNGKHVEIAKEDVGTFLMESLDVYAAENKKIDRTAFTLDADNLIMLMENWERLNKIDTLRVIRNLNENKYVIVDTRENIIPTFVASTAGPKLFENYTELAKEALVMLKESVEPLFNNYLNKEAKFYADRRHQIQNLSESQKNINHLIKNVEGLKNIAEANSPAMDRLDEQEKLLKTGLDKNMRALDRVMNHANPYTVTLNEALQSVGVEDFDTYVQSTGWQCVNDVLMPGKVANMLNEMETTDECRILVSDDMSHFLTIYQNHFTANWCIDLWSPLTPYDGQYKQNNFTAREEVFGYLGNISEQAEELMSLPQAVAKA
jgi:hypothetical protein